MPQMQQPTGARHAGAESSKCQATSIQEQLNQNSEFKFSSTGTLAKYQHTTETNNNVPDAIARVLAWQPVT